MSVEPLPPLTLDRAWAAEDTGSTRAQQRLRLRRADVEVGVELERCLAGRLATAYPVAAHDVEVRVTGADGVEALSAVLAAVAAAVQVVDPHCRRVVYAAGADRPGDTEAARTAGFRFIVEVDVPEPVELLVFEPNWVTARDQDLDEVPET